MKYAPRHKKSTNRWDFTVTEDRGGTRPFGYCLEYWRAGHHDGHHDNPEHAVECFIRFVIDNGLDYRGTLIMMRPCAACGEKTMNCVTRENQLFAVLCRDHANPDTVKKLVQKHMQFEVIPELAEDKSDPTPEVKLDISGAFHEAIRNRNKPR